MVITQESGSFSNQLFDPRLLLCVLGQHDDPQVSQMALPVVVVRIALYRKAVHECMCEKGIVL